MRENPDTEAVSQSVSVPQTWSDDDTGARNNKGPMAFRTISEVADELKVPQHVLRFWEARFEQVRPLKRGGGRRYYRPADVELLRRIATLLYIKGYTIKGVQRVLREEGSSPIDTDDSVSGADNENVRTLCDEAGASSHLLQSYKYKAFEAGISDSLVSLPEPQYIYEDNKRLRQSLLGVLTELHTLKVFLIKSE